MLGRSVTVGLGPRIRRQWCDGGIQLGPRTRRQWCAAERRAAVRRRSLELEPQRYLVVIVEPPEVVVDQSALLVRLDPL